ncbi:MAG: hypothetical protein R3A51_06525 [Nannocystaceae bacterium]
MSTAPPSTVTLGVIARSFWPLAVSWLLMSFEQPAVAIAVARLTAPEVNLAAWGGVVFPIALVIEAPIIMLLAASTALSVDARSYAALHRFTHRISAALTTLHALVAFTPLFDVIVERWLEVPTQVVEPARLGLQLMTPWTWAIASRRFHQGVMIRFGYSRIVGVGTALRLLVSGLSLTVGVLVGLPGVVVAGCAIISSVTTEALYTALRVRPIVRAHLARVGDEPPLAGWAFFHFYFPLSLTPLCALLAQPIGAAALSRMPAPLESLAAWPILAGLVFVFQSGGLAYNEVVVAHVGTAGAQRALRRFTALLLALALVAQLLFAATPLAERFLITVNDLSPDLSDMIVDALWLAIPISSLRALESWYQGVLVHARRTRAITESVAIFLLIVAATLVIGVVVQGAPGLTYAALAFTLGHVAQAAWQRWRVHPYLARLP